MDITLTRQNSNERFQINDYVEQSGLLAIMQFEGPEVGSAG